MTKINGRDFFFFFFFFWTRHKEKNLNLLLKIIINNKSHRWRKTALTTARECTYHNHQYVKWWVAQSSPFSDRNVSSETITSMSTSISVSADSLPFKSSFGWVDPSPFHLKQQQQQQQTNKQTKKTPRCHNISKLKYCTIEVHQYIWNCSLMM